jgi:hypothetical protein
MNSALAELTPSPKAADVAASAPLPELKKHLRAIESGNVIDRLWMEDERFDEIVSFCGIVASHCTSAAEAAWRRDKALTGTHLRHAREGLVLALKTFNMLPSDGRAV